MYRKTTAAVAISLRKLVIGIESLFLSCRRPLTRPCFGQVIGAVGVVPVAEGGANGIDAVLRTAKNTPVVRLSNYPKLLVQKLRCSTIFSPGIPILDRPINDEFWLGTNWMVIFYLCEGGVVTQPTEDALLLLVAEPDPQVGYLFFGWVTVNRYRAFLFQPMILFTSNG